MDTIRDWWASTAWQVVPVRDVWYLFMAWVVIGVLVPRVMPKNFWPRRKKPAGKREQQIMEDSKQYKKERSMVADAMFDGPGIFGLYTEGKLTRERYKYWMYRVGDKAGFPDFLPRMRITHPSAIRAMAAKTKTAILNIRKNSTERNKPVPLPDVAETSQTPKVVSLIPANARRRKGA